MIFYRSRYGYGSNQRIEFAVEHRRPDLQKQVPPRRDHRICWRLFIR